jgi:hypothetical protein
MDWAAAGARKPRLSPALTHATQRTRKVALRGESVASASIGVALPSWFFQRRGPMALPRVRPHCP